MKNTWLSWSTGKDSTYALCELLQDPEIKVTGLLTTINEDNNRVAMHSTRKTILEKQAEQLGLHLEKVFIPSIEDGECVNETYEKRMKEAVDIAYTHGVEQIAFGDLFLEDVREYREKQMSKTALNAIFPIWRKSTKELANKMLHWGLKACISCIDTKQIQREFIGREFNKSFLDDLPKKVDPCGENGEFHTVVYDCPLFKKAIPLQKGKLVERGQFIFSDFQLE